jgi:hypothetical protein
LSELEGDPRLMKDYLALLMIFKDMDPESLRRFVKSVRAQLNVRAAATGPPSTPALEAPRLPSSPQAAQMVQQGTQVFSLEVDVEVSRFLASLTGSEGTAGGRTTAVEATRTTVRIRITLENGRLTARRIPEDPLTLDLNGNGSFDLSNRADFDINVDGRKENIAFVSGGDAFLALDRNGNGTIDDGTELFGDQNGSPDGFEELARYDDNRDGVIDDKDTVFTGLKVMGDFDGDGDARDLMSVREAGIECIGLSHENMARRLAPDVTMTQAGTFTVHGRRSLAGVLLLKYA